MVEAPSGLTWSSLWPRRPDARVLFSLRPDASGHGTDRERLLLLDEPLPDASLVHVRMRVDRLVDADLRCSSGR